MYRLVMCSQTFSPFSSRSAAMLPRFPSTANSSPINSRPSSGASAGDEPYPIRAGESPHFLAGHSVEAIDIPVITAKINSAVMKRRARPEILMARGIDPETPRHAIRREHSDTRRRRSRCRSKRARRRWRERTSERGERNSDPAKRSAICCGTPRSAVGFGIFDREAKIAKSEKATEPECHAFPPQPAFGLS